MGPGVGGRVGGGEGARLGETVGIADPEGAGLGGSVGRGEGTEEIVGVSVSVGGGDGTLVGRRVGSPVGFSVG